jgi:serine/threonine-protein kinase
MNCTNCGQALTGESVFCSRCGTPTGRGDSSAEEPTFIPVKDSEVLDGKWRLERKIGEGGMGAVYLAHDLQLDRKVAIKILASALAHDAELVARFEREARFTASLEHPNIVPIYSVGLYKNRPFMVMKYLEGQPLSAVLREKQVLSLEETLAMMRQLCSGLEFIHQKGYVHRDIKAGNIFISPAGLATILDFGILRPRRNAESLTRTGMVMGTPQYMSPEQALGEREIDHRSDLYSLAVVLYECLAGVLPFDSDSDLSIIQMQAHAQAPDICARAKWVSRPVGDMVMRALAKRPQDRYQSATELASALEAAIGLQEIFSDGSAPSIIIPVSPEPAPVPPPAPPPLAPMAPRPSGPKELPVPEGVVPTSTVPLRLTPVSSPPRPSGPKAPPRASGPRPPPPAQLRAAPVPAGPPAAPVSSGPSTGELALAVRSSPAPKVAVAAAGLLLLAAIAYFALRSTQGPATDLTATASPTPTATASPPPELSSDPVAPAPPDPSAAPDAATPEDDSPEVAATEVTETEEEEEDPLISPAPLEPPLQVKKPSAAPTAPGKLNVITTFNGGPYWATIAVNGQDRGTTPVLLELPAGKHRIRVERAGFRTIEKQIKVASGRSAVLRIELVP